MALQDYSTCAKAEAGPVLESSCGIIMAGRIKGTLSLVMTWGLLGSRLVYIQVLNLFRHGNASTKQRINHGLLEV